MNTSLYDLYGVLDSKSVNCDKFVYYNFGDIQITEIKSRFLLDSHKDIVLIFAMPIKDIYDKFDPFDGLLLRKFCLQCSVISEIRSCLFSGELVRIGAVKIQEEQIQMMMEILYKNPFSSFFVVVNKDLSFDLSKQLIKITEKDKFSWKSILESCKLTIEQSARFVHFCVAEYGFSVNIISRA